MTLLTQRRQKQALCDVMHGINPGLDPDALDDECYYLWGFITDCLDGDRSPNDVYQNLMRLRLSNDDLKDLIDDILAMNPGDQIHHETLGDIGQKLPPISFLWPSWIPNGYLTTLAGEPGVGKSHLVLDLFKRIIHRLPGPDGQPLNTNTGSVVYVEAENFLAAFYQEAQRNGIDLSSLYVLRRAANDDILDLGSRFYRDKLLDMCFDICPDLIAIDSFSTVQNRGENSVEDIRGFLNFLANIATEFNTAVLLLHHLRKPQGLSTYTRVSQHDLRGSSHLSAMTRSLLGMWITSTDINGPRRIEIIKTNVIIPPMVFPSPLISRYQNAEIVYEHIAHPSLPDNLSGQCAKWLEQTLAAKGSLAYFELRDLANEIGYKENTLQNARRLLDWKIIDTVGPGQRGNKWGLYSNNGKEQQNGRNKELSHGSHGHVRQGGGDFEGGGVPHGHVNHVRTFAIRKNGHFGPKHPLFRGQNGHHPLKPPKFGLLSQSPHPRRQIKKKR